MAPTPPTISLEVCVDSLTSAITAANLGSARIELNAALELGGLTPSIGLVEQIRKTIKPTSCQLIAMVRPRPGGFVYNDDDQSVMQRDIDRLLQADVDGIAIGLLQRDGQVDAQATQTLIEPVQKAGKQTVFHRAFDLTPDPLAALQTLIDLGFTRILTSGQAATASRGADTIANLIQHADGRIEILPGSGITPDNAAKLIRDTGCNQLHASLRSAIQDPTGALNPAVQFNLPGMPQDVFHVADANKIKALMDALRAEFDMKS